MTTPPDLSRLDPTPLAEALAPAPTQRRGRWSPPAPAPIVIGRCDWPRDERPAHAGAAGRETFAGETDRYFREGDEGSGLYPVIALDDPQVRIGVKDGRFAATGDYADHPVAETSWAGAAAY